MRDSKLLSDIKNLLNSKKVEESDSIISLYTLFVTLNTELNNLKTKYIDFDLNKELKKNSVLNLNSKGNPLKIVPHLSFWRGNLNDSSTIAFEYDYRTYVKFDKNKCEDNLTYCYYFDDIKEKTIQKFIKSQYDNVLKLMGLIEEYCNLIGSCSHLDVYRENINTDIFDITLKLENDILLDNSYMLKFKIRINENHEDFCYSDSQKNNQVHRLINKNDIEIMKRIPVDVARLSEPFISIYQNYVEKSKEKQKVIKK